MVEEFETQEQASEEPRKAVDVDLVVTRRATLSDGRILENPRPIEHPLKRISVLQSAHPRRRLPSKN